MSEATLHLGQAPAAKEFSFNGAYDSRSPLTTITVNPLQCPVISLRHRYSPANYQAFDGSHYKPACTAELTDE
jgi:hypothetical protein